MLIGRTLEAATDGNSLPIQRIANKAQLQISAIDQRFRLSAKFCDMHMVYAKTAKL
jgi:hypothetical protein